MKTREELEAMTKEQLDVYGNENLGIDLDSRRKKGDMIACILKAQEKAVAEQEAEQQPDNDPEPPAEQDRDETSQDEAGAEPEQEAEPETGNVRVTVTDYSSSSGVPLFVNGREFHFPIGKTVSVPAYVLASLAAVADVQFTIETKGVRDQ